MKMPGKNLFGFFTFGSAPMIGIGILGLLLFAEILSRLFYPFDAGHYEAFNWMPARHLAQGNNPYAFALTPPYSMSPYGIVFYGLLAVGVKLFGFQLWWGRILSVLAFVVCLWAVAQIVKTLTESRAASRVACLACLAMFPVQVWLCFTRPDLTAAAFSLTAVSLALTVKEDSRINFRRAICLVLLLAAAFFTKHTFLLPVLIVFLRFLQISKYREAILLVAAFVLLSAAGIFCLNYTSTGGYLWQHWTHAQTLPFSFSYLFHNFFALLTSPAFFFFLLFLFAFIYRKRGFLRPANGDDLLKILRSPLLLFIFYFTISFAWAFVSAGRVGANINYYLESSLAAAVICGVMYMDFMRGADPKPALALVVLLTLGGTFQIARVLRGEYFRWQALSYYREIFNAVGRLSPPGSVCISSYPELVVWNGCDFHFDDFGEYVAGWSPSLTETFEREVRAGRYAVIILADDRLETKFPNYRRVPVSENVPEKVYPFYLYVRQAPPAR